MGKKNTEQKILDSIGIPLGKRADDPGRMALRACASAFLLDGKRSACQHMVGPLHVGSKKVQPDLKCIQCLSRIQVGHVLLSKETRDAVRIELRLCNIRVYTRVEISVYYDVILFLRHTLIPGSLPALHNFEDTR